MGNRSKGRRTASNTRRTLQGSWRNRRPVRGFVRRYKRELINGAAGAIIALLVTGILGADPFAPVRHLIQQEWYELSTSQKDKTIDEYLYVTYSWGAWNDPPTIFEDSEGYFREHFVELDPDSPHNLLGNLSFVPIPTVVAQSPSFSGRLIATGGIVKDEPNRLPSEGYDVWILQLQSPRSKDNRFTVYVRISASSPWDFRRDDEVIVEGLIIAAGTVRAKEGGSIDVAYLVGRSFCVKRTGCPEYSDG